MSDSRAMAYRQYTSVERVFGEWRTYLKIDQQSFCIATVEEEEQAEWYAEMLAVALERLCESHRS